MSANTLTQIAKRYLLYLQLERRLEVNTLNARWYDLEKYLSFLYKNTVEIITKDNKDKKINMILEFLIIFRK